MTKTAVSMTASTGELVTLEGENMSKKMFVAVLLSIASIAFVMLPSAALSAVAIPMMSATTNQIAAEIQCETKAGGQLKAVALDGTRTTPTDFSGTGGQLDPT